MVCEVIILIYQLIWLTSKFTWNVRICMKLWKDFKNWVLQYFESYNKIKDKNPINFSLNIRVFSSGKYRIINHLTSELLKRSLFFSQNIQFS